MDNPFLVLDERMSRIEEVLNQIKDAFQKPEPVSNERPVTQKELCNYLNVSEQTLIRWKNKKKIPFIQVGNVPRYMLKDVLKALKK